MRNLVSIGILVALAFGGVAVASTPNTGPKPWDSNEDGPVPSTMTRYTKCTVRRVEPPRRVTLWDHETRELVTMDLEPTVELTARRKKDFGGRQELVFQDLRPGHVVKVNYRIDTGRVVGLKVVGTAQ